MQLNHACIILVPGDAASGDVAMATDSSTDYTRPWKGSCCIVKQNYAAYDPRFLDLKYSKYGRVFGHKYRGVHLFGTFIVPFWK